MPWYRFDGYRLRTETGELLRDGKKVRLQPQPLQILTLLLARPGELVTRQELASALWGNNTFTDFDQGLNIAVKKLRDALGDSAEQPRLIETLPRRGYRFIGQVTVEPEILVEATQADPDGRPARDRWRNARRYGPVVAGVVLALVVWRIVDTRTPRVEFKPKDTVLVAQFNNETGETDLDGVLETALEAELTETPYVAIASPERVGDALKLMRRPASIRVPSALAREVCLRDPGIRVAIIGSVRKVGTGFQLSAEVIRPEDGRSLIKLTRDAAGRDGILRAVHSLAASIRAKLGEKLPSEAESRRALEAVTTRSLHALKLYSDAEALGRTGKWAAAELLLRQAIVDDPDFASANNLLAWALYNQGRPSREFMPFAEKAMNLAGSATEREAYYIRGSFNSLRQEHLQAKPYYEALHRRFPDHPWAYGILWVTYRTLGDRAADSLVRESLSLRPNNPDSYWNNAWLCLCDSNQDLSRVGSLVDRAVDLTRRQGETDAISDALWLQVSYRAISAWIQGDVDRCKAELDRHRDLPAASGGALIRIAAGYMTLGQLEEAHELLQRLPAGTVPVRWRMWNALFGGDIRRTSKLAADSEAADSHPNNVIGLLRAGHPGPAMRMLRRRQRPLGGWPPVATAVESGELAFWQGRTDKAIEILSESLVGARVAEVSEYLLGAQTLAKALAQRGEHEKAIAALERITNGPRACNGFYTAAFWPHARFDLMQLYLRQKRFNEAEAVRKELEGLLKHADANHVLKAGLVRIVAQQTR